MLCIHWCDGWVRLEIVRNPYGRSTVDTSTVYYKEPQWIALVIRMIPFVCEKAAYGVGDLG
jgi:hypothetical protein